MSTVLQPIDIPVALSLAGRPGPTFAELGGELGVSPSTAHASVKRLNAAGLVHSRGAQHEVNLSALEEFLLHGARYSFPPHRSRRQRGVPTAHSAPVLHSVLNGDIDPLVWPSPSGTVVGEGLKPLIPGAALFAEHAPQLYDLLALVDAIRAGTARDREVAGAILGKRLGALGR